jgi:hypothetical protein
MTKRKAPKRRGVRTSASACRAWPDGRAAARITALGLSSQALVWAMLYVAFGIQRIGYWFFDLSDLGYYYDGMVLKMAQGLAPFRDFFIEYPPLFVPLLAAPGTHFDERGYVLRFAVMMVALMAVSCVLSALAAYSEQMPSRAYATAILFSCYTLLLGPIAANRYDPAVALVLAGIILAMAHDRWVIAGVLIGVGFALKVTPIMLLPIVLLLAPRRSLVRALVGCGVAAAVPFACVLAEGGRAASNLVQMMAYHLDRPLEIESVLATPFWIGRLLGVSSVTVANAAGSQVVASATADLVAKLSSGVLLIALGAVFALVWRRRPTIASDPSMLFLSILATILASLMGSKVLSPQYFVWLIPAVALVAFDDRIIGALMAVALLLTHILFPANYWGFAQFQMNGPVILVVVRNLVLLIAFSLALRSLWRIPPLTV